MAHHVRVQLLQLRILFITAAKVELCHFGTAQSELISSCAGLQTSGGTVSKATSDEVG